MAFRVMGRHLGEIVVLEPQVYADERGHFMEAFRADQFRDLGLPEHYAQENHSVSRQGVIRGLHFQWNPPMGKVMRVTGGSAFLVAVDIRRGSPTVGRWYGIEVSAANRLQVWAPPGFARGFCALTDGTEVQYRCTTNYNPKGESGIRWNDPRLAIAWPVERPLLSAKDSTAISFDDWLAMPASAQLDP
jgi:dTDP-4-dehydrorhamnose 3,5-epimerase